jgi:hypothetical protein
MQTKSMTKTFTSCTSDPVTIEGVLNRLVALLPASDTNSDIMAPWAVARLGSKLGIVVAMSTSPDPVGVAEDLAEGWVDACRDALDRRPGQVAEVLRTAEAALRALIVEVKNRGLAP